MGTIIKLDSVQDYNELLGIETVHPLVSVVDFSELESQFREREQRMEAT